jgi:hypothetical protein
MKDEVDHDLDEPTRHLKGAIDCWAKISRENVPDFWEERDTANSLAVFLAANSYRHISFFTQKKRKR